nr:tyrosine-protein kinase [uncultured Dyadobacter sp.]
MHTQKFEIPESRRIHDWLSNPFWKSVKIYKYWFAFSSLASILSGFLYLRYKTPHYLITASLLVRDDSRGSDFQEAALLESLGFPAAASSVENEIEILKSRTLLSQVIDDLQLTTRCFASGTLKTTELYEKAPVTLRFISRTSETPETHWLTLGSNDTFTLETAKGGINGHFGDTLRLANGLAVINQTHFKPATDCNYFFSTSRKADVLDEYEKALTVTAPNKAASLVNLSLRDVLPAKGKAILQQLILDYQKASIDEKNKIADNTITFINNNLEKISAQLAKVETGIESFRRKNRVVDIAEDSRQALQNFGRYEAEEKELTVRLKIIVALADHLSQHPESVIPSSLYQQASGFVDLAIKYNEMQVQKARKLVSLPSQHPDITAIDSQLETIRNNLITGVGYQQKELAISIASVRDYRNEYNAEISRIPGQEKQLLSRSREQSIQQELYLFLLKKRMETAISRSSNIPNARTVDQPEAGRMPITPDKSLTMLISFLIGITCPLIALYCKQVFNDRVASKDDIQEECDAVIIGELSQQQRTSGNPYRSEGKSLIAEQFRTLRTNIQFVAESSRHKVILLTSAMAGEGKSFVAAHLSRSLALAGKTILLIDFDLRKPSLARNLQFDSIGLTDFLTGDKELIVQRSRPASSFDFLASGRQHPHPGELLLSSKIGEMIRTFRDRYDYILLDSPPIGLVSDARILGRQADMTLYIIRQDFTFRHQLADIQKMVVESQLPDIYLVVNGMKHLHSYQYSYYSNNS